MVFPLELIISVPFLIGLGVFSIFCDYRNSRGWSGIWAVALLVVGYFLFRPPLNVFILICVAWVPVGFAWSIWRWRRHCADLYDAAVKQGRTYIYGLESNLNVRQNVGTIVYWTLFWPISFVACISEDFIRLIERAVLGMFRKVFDGTSAKYQQKFDENFKQNEHGNELVLKKDDKY